MREKQDIRQDVMSETDPIETFIQPGDLDFQEVNSWEDADIDLLAQEIYESMIEWHFQARHLYESLIQELATILYINKMQRIPFSHLAFNSRDKCVIEGYWLYDMSKSEVRDRVNDNWDEIEDKDTHEHSAQRTVENWVIDKYLTNIE